MNAPNWLEEALQNPEITDLCLNGAGACFVDRGRGMEPLSTPDAWSDEDIRTWILHQLSAVGKSWDARHPFIDATLASGHRAHVSFPPIARQGILISLRRLPTTHITTSRWSGPLFEKLVEITRAGESVILSGATGSGKTTLANDLLAKVSPAERILALEDTPELAPAHPHFLSLISRPPNADGFGEVTLRTLLRQALRMRPDRIILGECRGPEVLELLQALNTGHRGTLATLHANTPRDALRRIELLCLLSSSGSIPLLAIRELLALGIQWIAQIRRESGRREIAELWKIEGREGETILMRPYTS